MDDSDKKPIIERVFTFIGSAVGFICGLIVAGALVENGNKDATIIVMGLVAPILFFRWAGQSIGEKIQSMMDGGKTKVINQLSEAAALDVNKCRAISSPAKDQYNSIQISCSGMASKTYLHLSVNPL